MIAQHPSFRIELPKTSMEKHLSTYYGARGDGWKKHANEDAAAKEKKSNRYICVTDDNGE